MKIYMNKPKIICTIGPSSMNKEVLLRFKDRGVDFFRINLSHTPKEEIEKSIKFIIEIGVPIIIDTEGLQIRSGNTSEFDFREGEIIKLHNKETKCDSSNLFLNPSDVVNKLKEGDLIAVDFNSVLFKVYDTSSIKKGYILCKVMIGGKIGGRKAVVIDSPVFKLPPFSDKDLFAVKLAKKYGIKHFTLSFMESAQDVIFFKKNYPNSIIFSKIESRQGLNNFMEIAKESDGILIDRGDLSHQVPLERVPLIQKFLINKVRKLGKQVFVATNTLETMSLSLKPNRAEVNDIINTILDGVTGIALTKETAVGKYPVETVNMLVVLINQLIFLQTDKGSIIERIEKTNYLNSPLVPDLLIKPHGGVLIDRTFKGIYPGTLPEKKIHVGEEDLMDIEQIAIGAFSPIEGFMCKEEFISVLERMRLLNGTIWPLPLILRINEAQSKNFKKGDRVSLIFENDNETYALLQVQEVYKIDKIKSAKMIYGTESLDHPGVRKFLEKGDYAVGGKITLLKRRKSPYKVYELTPRQTRRIFAERGWSRVIGFHTRNAIHRSHEFIQMEGLKESLCDGIFIHPIIGKKKIGDFEAEVIISSYEKMIEKFYPDSKVVLSSFASYSRYAGPREALFTAIVRKNFGCSHFIVGRDHTGVGNFYPPKASQEIFDKFPQKELGIIPVKFGNVFYSPDKKQYLHGEDFTESKKLNISGTDAREMFKSGKVPPEWFMRKEISEMISKKIKSGKKVFVE